MNGTRNWLLFSAQMLHQRLRAGGPHGAVVAEYVRHIGAENGWDGDRILVEQRAALAGRPSAELRALLAAILLGNDGVNP